MCLLGSRLSYFTLNETVNRNVYTTVLCTAFGGFVGGNRVAFTVTVGFDQRLRYAVFYEVVSNGVGTTLRQFLVVGVRTFGVGVTNDGNSLNVRTTLIQIACELL